MVQRPELAGELSMSDMLAHMLDRLPDCIPYAEQLLAALRMLSARIEILRCQARQDFEDIRVCSLHTRVQVGKIVIGWSKFLWPLVTIHSFPIDASQTVFDLAQEIDRRRDDMRDNEPERIAWASP